MIHAVFLSPWQREKVRKVQVRYQGGEMEARAAACLSTYESPLVALRQVRYDL